MADVGRPTRMTTEVLNKLEEVFAIGGSDQEACFYANISHQTLYNYQEKHPEFVERKESLKEKPILKARQTVVQSLNDPNHAFRYLSKKRRKEFGESLDLTTDGEIPQDTKGNTYNFFFSADVQKDVKEIEERIKAKLLNHAE